MKFIEPSPFADPKVAARKLVEIANGIEAVQDGRIYIELLNGAFLRANATPDQYRDALARAIELGWLWRHEFRDLCEVDASRHRAVHLIRRSTVPPFLSGGAEWAATVQAAT